MSRDFPRRTVHLDFHTSPRIADVARDFDAEAFADTFAAAHADSVTVFAKCHHGHLYYACDRPERHPGLPKGLDLLGEQIDALHRRGIKAPIYLSVLIDEYAAAQNPHWCAVDPENRLVKRRAGVFEAGWMTLDMSSPYQDYLAEQLADVLKRFSPIDGLFLDMCWDQRSCSKWTVDAMRKVGLDPTSDADRRLYARQVTHGYMARFKKMVDQAHKGRGKPGVWFNSRSKAGLYEEKQYVRHVEVECLPGGGWGYAYLPYVARLVQPLGLPTASHTVRFHKGWGDFGTLKNEAALLYECATMFSLGISCGVGDQMHPRGKLDKPAYETVGRVFGRIAACEKHMHGAELLSEAAVLVEVDRTDRPGACGLGFIRLLQESRAQFAFLPPDSLTPDETRLVIVPENVKADESLRTRLQGLIRNGGRVLFSGDAALDPEGRPLLPELGIKSHGASPYSLAYLRPGEAVPKMPDSFDWAVHEGSFRMSGARGAECLFRVVEPYFERSYEHFCSHAQTPPADASPFAGVVLNGSVAVFAMPVFTAYAKHGNALYRELFRAVLARLLPEPLLRCEGPVHLETTVAQLRDRTIVNLLSFLPACRTEDRSFETVEDPFPLVDMPISVKRDSPPRRVLMLPGNAELPFSFDNGRVGFRLTSTQGHVMLVIE